MVSSSLFSRCLNWGFEITGGSEELKVKQAGARARKVLLVTKCCGTCSCTLILDTWVTSASALHSSALHSWNTELCIHETQVVPCNLQGEEEKDELVFVRHTVTIAISSTEKLMRKVIAFHADSMQSERHGDTLWTMKEKSTEQLLLKWASSILCTGCSKALWSPVWPQNEQWPFNTHTGILNPAISNRWRPDFEILQVRTERVQYIVIQSRNSML